MSSNDAGIDPKALGLVEQCVHLLRRGSGQALAEYYLGSLPFVLALLYFWSDMSRNPMAGKYCGPWAAGVALAFVWMKLWHVRFCRRLWCRLQGAPAEAWPVKRMIATAARQAFVHAFGVAALPLAVLPLGWVYAFFQNLSILDDPGCTGPSDLVRDARAQTLLWPGQNHLALTIMGLFGGMVFFDLALGVIAIPYLLKWLFGIETVFTLSGMTLFNTTFLAVLFGLTYLCIDPVTKTFYVLRCFYGRARHTGDDIRSALRPFMLTGVIIVSLLIFNPSGSTARAGTTRAVTAHQALTADQDTAHRLDEAIETVLRQRRFAWRLPRESVPQPESDQGWIGSTIHWIAGGIKAAARTVVHWIEALIEWIQEKLPDPQYPKPGEGGDYRGLIRMIFYALGFGLILLMIYWLIRWLLRSRPMVNPEVETAAPEKLDLSDESVTAEDLPLDQWLSMARDLITRDDLRSALRALYLSVLAMLADHQRVTIARYKSNLDYARELARHAHAEPELLTGFEWCVRIFERAWYGLHPVSRHLVDRFMDQQQRMADLVQRTA